MKPIKIALLKSFFILSSDENHLIKFSYFTFVFSSLDFFFLFYLTCGSTGFGGGGGRRKNG